MKNMNPGNFKKKKEKEKLSIPRCWYSMKTSNIRNPGRQMSIAVTISTFFLWGTHRHYSVNC